MMKNYLGIDFGTSGARAVVIDNDHKIQVEVNYPFTQPHFPCQTWQKALWSILDNIPRSIRVNLRAIAINGTSATVILCDSKGNPLDEPILYHDSRGITVLEEIKNLVPSDHLVISATSSLAKLLWWSKQDIFQQAKYFLHQADWLSFLLHGKLGTSDYHNALKLGYDVENLTYPHWLENLPYFHLLPQVFTPGEIVGEVTKEISDRFNLNPECVVCAGTTDSIAAFLASGATLPGEAVTSLGSTLVLKLLSNTKIEDSKSGIYSHRLGNLWLTGGASNTGGAVLKHFFNDQELLELSQQINPKKETNLDYYPLLKPGERFPINNPFLEPKIEPRPENSVQFLQGLLEGIAS
jgi:D-ribulokinase